jgi:hypothetical protein
MTSGTDLHTGKPGKPLCLEIDMTIIAGKPNLLGMLQMVELNRLDNLRALQPEIG